MLETVMSGSTYIKTELGGGSDPLSWENQQFPDSNSAKFSPIKQEIIEPFDLNQTDFTELKPLPFDYGSAGLASSLDPILNNNNNNSMSSNNNNSSTNNKMADLYINIKPLSPPERDSFPFHASPSDVTSSGSISPQGMTKIDFTTDQNAFDDLANIVGLSVGADSTVPSLENDVDLEALFENIKPLPLLPNDSNSCGSNNNNNSGYDVHSSQAESNSISNHSISNQTLTNTQPYIGSLASLVKGSRMTIVEPRDSFPQNLSPILRGAITGTAAAGYHLTSSSSGSSSGSSSSYPQIKFENLEMMKQEYYHHQEQLPHSTVADHRRMGQDGGCIIRSKPKAHKMKQRTLLGSAGSSPQGSNGSGSGNSGGGGGGSGGDLSKKMMHHCQICNRGFLNKSNIKVHLRTHTGEKPFGCEHCSKAFRQKAHLLKHMSIHKRISRD